MQLNMLVNGTTQCRGLECHYIRSPFPLTGCVPLLFRYHVFCVFKYSAVSNLGKAAVPWCTECLQVVGLD